MWILSKQSKQLALAHSELELLISERTAELQALSQRLLRVQDDERRKIARDLHDTTGQTLAALKISITMLEDQCKHLPAALPIVRDVESTGRPGARRNSNHVLPAASAVVGRSGIFLRRRVVHRGFRQTQRNQHKGGPRDLAGTPAQEDGNRSLPRIAGEFNQRPSSLRCDECHHQSATRSPMRSPSRFAISGRASPLNGCPCCAE